MYKITSIKEKKWQDKVFYELGLEGQSEPVSCWGDLTGKVVGDELDGVVAPNKKGYPQLTLAGVAKGFSTKKADIAEAQTRKENSIAKAQDRSALMWAKVGATELIAHHPAFKNVSKEGIEFEIEKLTTEIYNIEPTQPF